nr:putative ribonuclease H-like domain-containing protein [Tanacetum cinerariifolium]
LKTFGGNEATKKTKKNLLKQQYENFKAEGAETLEQTFTRLQVIVVWRNRSDLDTMSLDDLYNHLKVYEVEVQKKLEPNTQNMAFISSTKHSRGNDEVNTASRNVPTASANFATVSISQETACAYIASQSGRSQIKFEDINQINEDDMEEMDIKWNMALLSMRADKYWKKTGKKICFKDKIDPRNQERGRRDTYRQGSKAKEQTPKELMAIDGTGLPECADDTVTDYSRPSPTVESSSEEDQNRNHSAFENVASPITPKQFVKFIKTSDSQSKSKTDEKETPEKPPVKNAEQYRKPKKKPNSYSNRPFQRKSTVRSQYRAPWVPTVNGNFPPVNRKFSTGDRIFPTVNKKFSTASRKFPTGSTKGPTANMGMKGKAVKPLAPFQRKSTVRSQYRAPWVPTVNGNFPPVNRKFSTGDRNFPTANKKLSTASRKFPTGSTKGPTADMGMKGKAGSSQNHIDDKGYWDSGCSRHMTGNISYLSDYEPFDGGYVSFGQGGCKITGKGTIKTECIVLRRDFKLLDDANILLRTPRQHNMYSNDLNNIVPHRDLTCLVAKASADECNLWHRRLGHLNFKTMNKLVRHNLVRGLPTKCFENDHNCSAYLKGKQHKASCKSKLVTSMTKPLHTLHMDLFGPTSISSISHKWYFLVVTDDFSRFTWTFFLRTKDETSSILRKFITKIENLKDLKVKIIRCDNGGEFRNKELNDFCSQKGIKREFSNARTHQQNDVAERRNRSLIEAARTMLADAKLLVTFWAEAVNTACYV